MDGEIGGTRLDFCSPVARTASHQLSFVSRFLTSLLGDGEFTNEAATVEFSYSHVMAPKKKGSGDPILHLDRA